MSGRDPSPPWPGLPGTGRRWVAPLMGLAVFALVSAGMMGSYVLLPAQPAAHAVADVVRIPPGASAADIGVILENRGIIRSADYFRWVAGVLGVEGRLQAGDYELSPGMNLLAVVRRLEQGEVATVRVTIPEGLNARQIAALLEQRELVQASAFLDKVEHGRDLVADTIPFALPTPSVEGYLYPDTYLFPPYLDEEEVIRRMVNRFVQVAYPVIAAGLEAPVDEEEDGVGPGSLGWGVHEVVTLASIVEKEAMRDAERPTIAGVFYNRLLIGQPLQSDPTVQYVMPVPRARLFLQDLAIDSPYNTYRYRGLPPGPIASPGLASVRAVLYPERTPYMYFVARGDGTHVFSTTFQEHVAARRRLGR